MLSWLRSDDRDIYALIAGKNYPRAIRRLEKELEAKPQDIHQRQLLADLWERVGQPAKSIAILEPLVEEMTGKGFSSKAIALLKRILRLDPKRADVERRLASLQLQQDGYGVDAGASMFESASDRRSSKMSLGTVGLSF